jgi:hypothetical protein
MYIVAMLAGVILKRVFSEGRINLHRGAIAVYAARGNVVRFLAGGSNSTGEHSTCLRSRMRVL